MAEPQDYAAPGSELQQLLARFAAQPYVPPGSPQGSNSWVGGGINAGIRELRGAGGSAVEALGKLTGLAGLEQWGAEAAENNYRRAAEVGRPDLDIAPWREGGASVLPWLTYQTAKNLPLLGAMFAAPYAIPAAAVPAAAVRAGMSVPSWLGGGAGFARNVAGATLAGYLPAAGGIYREAKEGAEQTGSEVTAGTAAAALGAGLPSAVIGGLQPQVLRGILGKDVSEVGGGVLRRLATAGVEGGLAQLPAEGAQAAIEMGFRPDLTFGQKAQRVVDAALTGAALGGVLGAGAGGVREMRGRSPVEVSNEDLSGTVDQQLNLPLGEGAGPAPARPDGAPPGIDGGVDPRQLALGLEDVAPRQTSVDLVGGAGVAPARSDLTSPVVDESTPDLRQREMFPVEQSLPLALPEQMAPPAPDLAARPLAREPLARLESVVRVAEYKRAVGAELEPAESAVYQAAVGELQARTQARGLEYLPNKEGVPQRAAQRSLRLEGGTAYTDPVTAPDPRPQPKVTETQPEMFRRVVGVKLPAPVLAASDLPTALDMIDQAASKRNAPKWALDAAKKLGLDGTLDTRIAEAEAKVAETVENPARALDTVRTQNELTLLQARKAAIEEMQRRRAPIVDESTPPPAPDTPVFSSQRSATTDFTPLGDAPFQRAFSRSQARLGAAAAALKVVPTVADLPERVRQAALTQGIPESDIRGTYYDGVGYLVRENVRTEADVQEVALHEIFGHKGARTLLGEGAADKMIGLFDKAGGIAEVTRIARRFNADTALKEYIPDGPLTDADKARVFDEMLAQATGKADGTLKLTALTWAGQIKHQVIKFLEGIGMTALARRMDGFTSLDTAVMLRNMRKAVQAGYEVSPDQSVSFSRATDPVTTNDAYSNAAQSVIERASNATSDVMRVAARKTRLYVSSAVDMARTYGPFFQKDANGQTTMDRINVSNDGLGVERKMLNRAFEAPLQEFQKLAKKTQTDIRDLLYTASALDMDPAKSWEEHKHLHKEPQLRPELMKLNKINASLRQRDGGTVGPVMDAIIEQGRTDWYLGQYSRLQGLMKLDLTVDHKSMPSFQSDVLTDLKLEGITSKSLPEISARAKAALYATLADATAHTKALRTELNTTLSMEQVAVMQAGKPVTYTASQRQQLGQFADLEQMVSNIQASIARIETAPYVHLGRSGDFYVGGKIAGTPDANGEVTRADQRSVEAIQDALTKAGFEDVRMIVGNDNPSMFVRVETQSQATALQQVMQSLQRQGHFQKTEKIFKGSGAEADVRTGLERMVPHYIERVVAAIKDRPEFKGGEGATAEETSRLRAAQAQMIESVRSASLEMLPAEAFGRLTARRAGVHGVSGDFVRNQAKRARAGANHIANLHYAPELFDALGQMHEEVRTAEREGARGINELADMKGAYLEFFRRQATPAPLGGNQWVDIARSATHSYLTAMSPAYAAIQLTQPAVLGLPELGKRFGYMSSAKAMAQSSTVAFNVLREAVKAGWKDNKARGATDMLITPEVLAKAGVDTRMASFIMRQITMGSLEFGTQVSELGMLADADVTSKMRKYSQYANTTGFAAEAFTRLLMSVSTYKLAKGNPNLDYIAHDVMQNSMFNYGPANTAQLLNPKSGFLGPATGLASVFMKFQAMLVEKFYGEMGKAFLGQAANAAERTQARKFLAGHAAALTVLGGSMALPMVSVLARLTDKMVDMTGEEGDEPYDVKAAWRGWLSDIFGKEMGEIAARGVPRALGVDISARVGEQDILPFSKFLTDRRDANEAIEDLALRMEGAGVSTAINIWTGLNDIFNRGDVMGGMIKVLPTALRNPAMAFKMGEMGYVDTKNAPLPITPPTGRSIAAQAMGFAPSEMSEYREARQSQITRKTDLESMAGLIRKHYATAVEQGDQDGAQEALRQMQVFDRKNPAHAVGPGLASVLLQRQMAPMMARQLGVPLGVNRRDVGARGLTEWANY